MIASEYEAWRAQIDLTTNVEELRKLLGKLLEMDPVVPMLTSAARRRIVVLEKQLYKEDWTKRHLNDGLSYSRVWDWGEDGEY